MALVAVTNEQNRNSFLLAARLVANDRCLLDASLHTFYFRVQCLGQGTVVNVFGFDCTARCAYGILYSFLFGHVC